MQRQLMALVVLVALALVTSRWLQPVAVTDAHSVGDVSMTLGPWSGYTRTAFPDDVVAALGVDEYVHRTYALGQMRAASVYIGYYRSQRQGSSIHSPLNCLPGAGWEPVAADRVAFADGAARRVIIQKGRERLLVLYWYQTAARVEGDEYRSRLFTIFDTIRHRRNDAAIVRVIVSLDGPESEAPALAGAADLALRVEREVARLLFNRGTDRASDGTPSLGSVAAATDARPLPQ